MVSEYACFASKNGAEYVDNRNQRYYKRPTPMPAAVMSTSNAFSRNTTLNVDYYNDKFAAFYGKNCMSVVMAKDPLKILAAIMLRPNYDPASTHLLKQVTIKNVVSLAEYFARENSVIDLQLNKSYVDNYAALSDSDKQKYELNPFTVSEYCRTFAEHYHTFILNLIFSFSNK